MLRAVRQLEAGRAEVENQYARAVRPEGNPRSRQLIADVFDNTFQYTEGYPGIKDPSVKDWFVAHQGPASAFISAAFFCRNASR